jgi:arginine/lysine/ornithine decarboxylase
MIDAWDGLLQGDPSRTSVPMDDLLDHSGSHYVSIQELATKDLAPREKKGQ